MNRALLGTMVAVGALAFVACDDGLGDYVEPASNCGPYLSCETCTPVPGCGWCSDPNGSGVCASDPSLCPTLQFSWTWNPSGCRVPADASVTPTPDASQANDAPAIPESGRDSGPSSSDAPHG